MPLTRGYELEVLDRGGIAASSPAAAAILAPTEIARPRSSRCFFEQENAVPLRRAS